MEGEVWKDIPGYEGYYRVSNLGGVVSLDRFSRARNGGVRLRKGGALKKHITNAGREIVCLSRDSIHESILVSRLVAESFLGLDRCNTKMLVCHKDDNPFNNFVGNLFLGTHKDNYHDMVSKGRRRFKQPSNNFKYTFEYAYRVYKVFMFTDAEIENYLGHNRNWTYSMKRNSRINLKYKGRIKNQKESIPELRQLGMTYSEISKKLRISIATISRYLNSHRAILGNK